LLGLDRLVCQVHDSDSKVVVTAVVVNCGDIMNGRIIKVHTYDVEAQLISILGSSKK